MNYSYPHFEDKIIFGCTINYYKVIWIIVFKLFNRNCWKYDQLSYIFLIVFIVIATSSPWGLSELIILCKPSSNSRSTIRQCFSTGILPYQFLSVRDRFNLIQRVHRWKKFTLIFLLKFLSFLFFMYLWIFSFLCSTESFPTLKVDSSKLDISGAKVVELPPPFTSCWLSALNAFKWIKNLHGKRYHHVLYFQNIQFRFHYIGW